MARILVVDDEIGIRELLSEILYDEGHTVELAENAAQARASRLRARPDLVLLDIWMPDTDGVSLLKEWGSQGLLDMPVIMMIDFLEKPITLQKLLKTIAAGLARPVVTPGMAAMARLPEKRAEFGRPHIAAPVSEPIEGVNEASNSLLGSIPLDQPLRNARDEFERIYFEYHLGRENHSMTRVSEKTGLERTHLYRKLKQLGIDSSRKKNN